MSAASQPPRVSVVMSVYNGSAKLPATIDSILQQTFRDYEFLIVNDGSTDDSLQILNEYRQQDSRIAVIDQPNAGLTVALDTACRAARGDVICRQDVGDVSLPERLEHQLACFATDPRIVAVGVGCRRVGPNSEFLGDLVRHQSPDEVTQALHQQGVGLMHASSAFLRSAFLQVGGYRSQFRYAQDTDLWYRLSSIGFLAELPIVLFEVLIEAVGISGQQIQKQIQLANIARACHHQRQQGQPESQLLLQASQVSQSQAWASPVAVRTQSAKAAYFIGSLLFANRDPRCRTYLARSMKIPGPVLAAMAKYMLSFSTCRSGRTQDSQ